MVALAHYSISKLKIGQIWSFFGPEGRHSKSIRVKFSIQKYTTGFLSRAKFIPDRLTEWV